MNIQIRPAVLNDLAAIDAFDVFAGERGPEIKAGEIVVAIAADEAIGYLKHNKKFYSRHFVWYLCVHKDYRRKGAAKLLFDYFEDYYKDQPLLFSSTEADNVEMLNFFEKQGYRKSGSIENLQKVEEVIFVKGS